MLGKLFKYEFKNTAKIMLTIYGVLIAVTALGMIVLSFDTLKNSDQMLPNLIMGSTIILYVLSVFALFIVGFVYLSIHFYKIIYSAQGYLIHTLPVTPIATFHVKLLTALVWMLISMLLCVLSVFGIISSAAGPDFWNEFSTLEISELNAVFLTNVGMTLWGFCGCMVLGAVLSALIALLLVYTSCSIGQLFHQYKVVASVITGIVLYFVQQILSTVIGVIISFNSLRNLDDVEFIDELVRSSMWLGFGVTLIFILAYYITCNIIVRKHINLE